MDKELVITLVQVAAPVILAGIGWFVRSFFHRLEKDIQDVAKAFAKFEGQLLAMSQDLRNNTVETVKTSAEVRALWRVVDGGHQRSSDMNGPG